MEGCNLNTVLAEVEEKRRVKTVGGSDASLWMPAAV